MAKNPTTPNTAATAAPVAMKILGVTASVPMPEVVKNKRGSKSQFPFADLTTVGASFGVIGRTAKSLSSIVSAQNRKADNMVPKKDDAGNVVFKTQNVKDANGNMTTIPTSEPVMIQDRDFFAVDVDATKDPEGASVRVFRRK